MTNLYLNFNLVCRFLSPFYSEHSLSEIRNRLTPISSVPWQSVIDIANNFLVTPALWSSLKAKGIGAVVEKEPRDYLCRLYGLNKRRNTHLRRQLLNAIGVLNSAGLSPLLLKGAGQLVQPIHEGIGSRLMTDLDILIRPGLLSTAIEALKAVGYEESKVSFDPEKLHHWAPLIRHGEYGAIELHRQALNCRVTHMLLTREIFDAAETKILDGAHFLLPSATHAIMICLLHSQEFNASDDPRQINLRTLHDLTAISMKYCDKIDWPSIQCLFENYGLKYLLESYLVAARQLFNMPYPSDIQPGPFAHLHHKICLGTMRWSALERLSRWIYDFLSFRISQRYGCQLRFVPLTAYRMRFLVHVLRSKVKTA